LEYLFVGIIFLVVVGLVYQSLSSSKSRRLFLVGVSVFVLGYLIFNNLIVIENADASLILGSIGSGILGDRIPVFIFGRPIHYVLSSKYLVLLLSIVSVWMVFYPPKFVNRPDLITAVLGGILVFVSGYQLSHAFYWQAVEKNIFGGFTVTVGLPLILIGSLLIVIAGVKKIRSEHYDQTASYR